MRIADYITEKEGKEFCNKCNEICSRHCVIWRKAETRHDEAAGKIPCFTHDIKILPEFYNDVESGRKSFEIRKNDRDYKVGDYLLLREWDGEKYTGRKITRYINYIFLGTGKYGIAKDYCILGIIDNGNIIN